MIGRIRKKQIKDTHTALSVVNRLICPLCKREIPDTEKDAHHLVPKSKGGRITQYLHRVCHKQIHALLTEAELATQYNSVDALLKEPRVARFVDWVKTKPDNFYERVRKSDRIRKSWLNGYTASIYKLKAIGLAGIIMPAVSVVKWI